MNAHDKLIAEARRWRADRTARNDAVIEKYHYLIEPDGEFFRLTIFTKSGNKVHERLTPGEANRMRLELSDMKLKGKVTGRGAG